MTFARPLNLDLFEPDARGFAYAVTLAGGDRLMAVPSLSRGEARENALQAVQGFKPFETHLDQADEIRRQLEGLVERYGSPSQSDVDPSEWPAWFALLMLLKMPCDLVAKVERRHVLCSQLGYVDELQLGLAAMPQDNRAAANGLRTAATVAYREFAEDVDTLYRCAGDFVALRDDAAAMGLHSSAVWLELWRAIDSTLSLMSLRAVQICADDLVRVTGCNPGDGAQPPVTSYRVEQRPVGWAKAKASEFLATPADGSMPVCKRIRDEIQPVLAAVNARIVRGMAAKDSGKGVPAN